MACAMGEWSQPGIALWSPSPPVRPAGSMRSMFPPRTQVYEGLYPSQIRERFEEDAVEAAVHDWYPVNESWRGQDLHVTYAHDPWRRPASVAVAAHAGNRATPRPPAPAPSRLGHHGTFPASGDSVWAATPTCGAALRRRPAAHADALPSIGSRGGRHVARCPKPTPSTAAARVPDAAGRPCAHVSASWWPPRCHWSSSGRQSPSPSPPRSTPSTTSAPTLEGTEWVLAPSATESLAGTATLTLQDGTATGNDGCTDYFAPYTVSGSALSFGPIGVTYPPVTCAATPAAFEAAYFGLLASVSSYVLIGSTLTLVDGTGQPGVDIHRCTGLPGHRLMGRDRISDHRRHVRRAGAGQRADAVAGARRRWPTASPAVTGSTGRIARR